MKILLINPPIREWSKPNIVPLGLGYIASMLRNCGHRVQILDINAYRWTDEVIEEKIKNAEFDIVGIGAIITVYRKVKYLISLLKKYHPSKLIMIGGSVGASIPEIILQKTAADIVCIGEGEKTVVDIVNSIEEKRSLNKVKGIIFKDGDGNMCKTEPRESIANLDDVPFPAWDLFPMDIYLKNPVGAPNRNKWIDGGSNNGNIISMNLMATRGCPYQCIYCYHDFMGQKYRHRSVESIIAEIKLLNEKYGVAYIHFMDDEFCLDKNFVYAFCKAVKSEFKSNITWGCSGRVNLVTEDLIATMADAGCVLIGYGIESGSQKMLDVIKKGVTVEQSKTAIELTKKYLGWADCSFMIGVPGENKSTIQETIDFCKELALSPEVIFFMTPYPGTELYRMALSAGKIPNEELYVLNLGEQGEKVSVNFTEFSDKELVSIQERMIRELGAWNKLKHIESR